MDSFRPSGVITLTTDFGLADPFVGVMKGRILGRFPAARIVDLSHGVPAQAPEVAGFWLARSFEQFPVGTVHVAVVDPGVGTSRAILCMGTRGHALLAPDNGLLERCAVRDPRAEVRELSREAIDRLGISRISATFHGRDIFAPVAAEVAAGRCPPEVLGPARILPGVAAASEAVGDGTVVGRVVAVDHFGNLITDIDAERISGIAAPQAELAGRTVRLRRTYGDVEPGELLALINSFEVLEIALAQGSAAAVLGVGRGARVSVRAAR